MHSTSVYGLEVLVLERTGGKALANDHRVRAQRAVFSGFWYPERHHCEDQSNAVYCLFSQYAVCNLWFVTIPIYGAYGAYFAHFTS